MRRDRACLSFNRGKTVSKRYRLFRRSGVYYYQDAQTGKQISLKTTSKGDAHRVLHALEESVQTVAINLQIARAYLHAADPAFNTRTWADVIAHIKETKKGDTRRRWEIVDKDPFLFPIKDQVIVTTGAELFLKVLRKGTVSTNIFLRRIHNFALDMSWLLNPVIPRRAWPKFEFRPKRAITLEEHLSILNRELNPERKAFYELCWHLGASQGDLAHLHAEDVDWQNRVINYERAKTKWRGGVPPQVRFGSEVAAILERLPRFGPLFPYLITVRSGDRATEFKQRLVGLGIKGVSLHSYRYAWAERARTAGYPEQFAMLALGHNSKAMARAYAKRARVEIPALEDFEKAREKVIIMPILSRHGVEESRTGFTGII